MSKLVVACLLIISSTYAQQNELTARILKPKFTVHFDFNSFVLNTNAKKQLDSIVHLIKVEPLKIQKIEIAGHCDSVGSHAYNDVLSLKRVQTVNGYLRAHGTNDSLIKNITGYGKRQPLNDNLDALKRSDNRRVEIVFQLAVPAAKNNAPDNEVVAPIDSSELKTLDLSHAQVNDIIELENINFYADQHIIVEESRKNLKILLNTMQVNKTLRIQIRGHVCCIPSYQADAMDDETYTEDLSFQRAKQIYLYLVENGIDRDRMTYVGLGSKYPLVREITNADKAKNRRVEIKILSK